MPETQLKYIHTQNTKYTHIYTFLTQQSPTLLSLATLKHPMTDMMTANTANAINTAPGNKA